MLVITGVLFVVVEVIAVEVLSVEVIVVVVEVLVVVAVVVVVVVVKVGRHLILQVCVASHSMLQVFIFPILTMRF